MKKLPSHSIRRAATLALVLFLLLPNCLVQAQLAEQPITINLNYTHPNGSPEMLTAIPVGYPGYEDAWWLFVNQHAQNDPASSITVLDNFGMYPGGFSIQAGAPASDFFLLDADRSLNGPFIELIGLGLNGETLGTYRLFISLKKENPDPPEVVIQPAAVTIHFRDGQGQPVAPSIQATLPEGTHEVYAQPESLPEGYTLIGPDVQSVTVDINGANPSEVIFVYTAPAATPVPTEVPIQPATIFIHFRDGQGQPVAPSIQVALHAGTQDVYARPENLMEGYTLIGSDVQSVTVDENGAIPSEVVFVYLGPAATPVPTEVPIPAAQITVSFLDEGGNPVADQQTLTLPAGASLVTPSPVNLQPGYELTGRNSYEVTVDINGASPNAVRFIYKLSSPVSQPVNVPVSYVDESGIRIAEDTVFTAGEGTHAVTAAPAGLPEGYALLPGEDAVKYVTITQNVAAPSSLSFIYRKLEAATATPQPPPKAALVNVIYKNEAGMKLFSTTAPCKENEETIIAVDLTRVDTAVYQLISEPSHIITVDSSGNPSQREVVFLFKDITLKTAVITIFYRDNAGRGLSSSQSVTIEPGTTRINAAPDTLPEGYVLESVSPVEVTLSQSGAVSHKEVVFVYRRPATPTPAPTPVAEATVIPFDVTTMDRYAYPTGDSINFRSSPDSSRKDNILSVVSQKDLAQVMGSVKNSQGEEWYLADIAGQEGFLKATVARLLEFNEVAAIFGWTPTPPPAPTPSSEVLADGEIIDRWAEVTIRGGVNFRAKASSTSTRIGTLEMGERFWVFSQQTVGADVWYSILANGKAGHVMAQYTRLYSEQESLQYQATLATPMPHSTTPTPTAQTITAVPATATPLITNTPVATATPTVYHGPALTIRQTALRTGVSQQDEPVLKMLAVNSLVQVWNQTWVGSEGWSQVQVMADMQVGYVPNSSLRYINEQEAAFYLAQLQPQVTATPSPTRQPDQRTGYSISRGENVPMRAFPDTNAQILNLLPEGAVVAVRGQEYAAGSVWDVVQYGVNFGYVRSDQLRILSAAEELNYLNSLRTPTPAPAATPLPVTLNSASSYGYVNADRVRLRSEASTSSRELKLMSKNAFALVYGSSVKPDGVWYRISQDGTVGYIHGDFFTVLSMGELSGYLQSPAYLNANSASIPVAGGYQKPSQITPLENYNATVWQNPNLVNVSYEPFNPLGSPTPAVEAILTPSPTPDLSPSPTLMMVEGFEEPPEKADSNFPTGLLAVGLIALLGGGGYYAYHLYNQNQKRAAARAAQRRAQAAQQAGQPQARPAAQQPSPYAPPRPGMQGTVQYKPGAGPQTPVVQPGQQLPAQGTAAYRPQAAPGQTTPGAQQPPAQGTAAYKPQAAPGQTTPGAQQPPTQGTAAYRPQGQPGQQPPAQGTAAYRPQAAPGQTTPGAQQLPPAQGTQNFRPQGMPGQPGQPPAPTQGSAEARPQGTSGQPLEPGQELKGTQNGSTQPTAEETRQANEARKRRSDRRGNA